MTYRSAFPEQAQHLHRLVRTGAPFGHRNPDRIEFGGKSIQDTIRVYDLHATLLHVLGLDHTKLSFPHEGRQDTLTDVAVTDAEVNKALLA